MAAAPELAPGVPLPPVQQLAVDMRVVRYGLTNDGAGLTKAELQGAKMREQAHLTFTDGLKRLVGKKTPEPPPIDIARPVPGAPLPLAVGIEGARPFPAAARYAVSEDAANRVITFTARQGQTEIVKTLRFPKEEPGKPAPAGFDGSMTVTVRNLGAEALSGELALHFARSVEAGSEESASFFGGVGNQSFASCSVGEKIFKLAPAKEAKHEEQKGAIQFFGINQQYFLGALYPLEGPRDGRCVMDATEEGRSVAAFFALSVPPGHEATYRFGLFVGPKDGDVLAAVPDRMQGFGLTAGSPSDASWTEGLQGSRYPHLERTVDFGMWAVICKVLLFFMKWFYRVVSNWGVAIILLTVLVKLILLPLTHKSLVSAEAMKKLQPKIEELRKKYADDRNRQNMEMMKLYQEAKVNPLGGCLPMLLQMPVWIALFQTLRNSYDIYREPFISPIWTDLTYKDPTYILPLALGITMIATQRLQPQMMDPVQARIMTYVMPAFFTLIMLSYPAGLSLYILTNNVLSIAQQYGLRKYLERKGIAAPRAPAPRKGGSK